MMEFSLMWEYLVSLITFLLVPPLDQRRPHTLWSVFRLLSLSAICHTGAIQIRFRHPNLATHWRILFLLVSIRCSFAWSLSFYSAFLPARKEFVSTFWTAFDSASGMGSLALNILIADALFLGREDEFVVLGAEKYREWLDKQRPALSSEGKEQRIQELTGGDGYTLERPRWFPGTKNGLASDMAGSRAGYGYGLEVKGKPKRVRAGYEALIASEKLSRQPPGVAQAMKRDALRRLLTTMLGYFIAADVSRFIAMHPFIITKQHDDWLYSLYESTKDSPLGASIANLIASAAHCGMLICTLQLLYLAVYLLNLLRTPAVKAPIAISLWEPYWFISPHKAVSVSDVWSLHWHPMPRRFFVIMCLRPARSFAKAVGLPSFVGRAAGIVLSFALSGLMHELALEGVLGHLKLISPRFDLDEASLRSSGYGFGAKGFTTTRAFITYGCVIVVEQIWLQTCEPLLAKMLSLSPSSGKVFQGRRRAALGWIWTMLIMSYLGIPLIDSWCMHGLTALMTPSLLVKPLLNYIS